jgi:hypothetical protein
MEQSVVAKGNNAEGDGVWLIRIDEATYLLIDGFGPQDEGWLYTNEEDAIDAFRCVTTPT